MTVEAAPVAPVFPVGPVTVEAAPVAPVLPVGPATVEAAPVGPVFPVGPATVLAAPVAPVFPVGPVTVIAAPVGPVVPVGPVTVLAAPAGPVSPIGPVLPVFPVGPVTVEAAPAGPVNPVGPVLPVAPVPDEVPAGPVNPVGPVLPVNPVGPIKYPKLFQGVTPSPILTLYVSVSFANSPARRTGFAAAQFAAVSCRSWTRLGTVGHCDITYTSQSFPAAPPKSITSYPPNAPPASTLSQITSSASPSDHTTLGATGQTGFGIPTRIPVRPCSRYPLVDPLYEKKVDGFEMMAARRVRSINMPASRV